MVWLLNVKLGAVQSTYYMGIFKFPNFQIGPCGISAPYTAESARYDADPCAHDKRRKMRTIC